MNDVILAIVILVAALVGCFGGGFHAGRIYERWKISRNLAGTITKAVAQCIADPNMRAYYGIQPPAKKVDPVQVQPGNDRKH